MTVPLSLRLPVSALAVAVHGVSRLERPGPGIKITFASVHHDMAATAALVSTTRLIQEVFFLIIVYFTYYSRGLFSHFRAGL